VPLMIKKGLDPTEGQGCEGLGEEAMADEGPVALLLQGCPALMLPVQQLVWPANLW
jgi:hypothetical protein